MKDISNEEKIQILNVVLESKTFSKSPTSTSLLRFLVEATIQKRELKETTVGLELFGSQFLDQNNSSRIRVNIWKDTTVIVGDFFGFMAKTQTGRIGWNRDYQINSLDQFYEYQSKATYSYLTGMGAISVHQLAKLFASRNQDFSIRFSSKSSYEDIKEHNSIYIGPTKNENKFIQYFNERNLHFKIEGRKLYYNNPEKKKDTILNLDIEGSAYEYAIVSRLKGDKGTEQFLFFSDHDMGVIGAVEYFCNAEKLKEFKESHLDNTETFTAVFVANGKERTNLDLNLILLDNVN